MMKIDDPCLDCGFYDPDVGCICPPYELWLAPCFEEQEDEDLARYGRGEL